MHNIHNESTSLEHGGSSRHSMRWFFGFSGALRVWGGLIEGSARLLLPKMSRIEARVVSEHRLAVQPPPHGKPMALFLGNSLMNADVDFDRLRQGVGSMVEIRRFVVESTGYWDWYYGIQRLLAEGAQPDVIVLVIGRHDLLSRTVRGDYFANRLMRAGDVLKVGSDLKLHPTATANLLAANLSTFYGLRSEIRKVLMGRLLPDVPVFVHKLTTIRGAHISPEELAKIGGERLASLNALAKAHHIRFIFVLAPEPRSNEVMVAPLRTVAGQIGVPLVLAMHNGQMAPCEYSDGFHMNGQGAIKYTEALIPEIRKKFIEVVSCP